MISFDLTKNPEDEPYFILGHRACGLPLDQARDKGKTADRGVYELAIYINSAVINLCIKLPNDLLGGTEVPHLPLFYRNAGIELV